MTRLKTSSGQFGLIGGICRASSDCILVEEPSAFSALSRWKGNVYILAEPVLEGGRGYHIARQVITEIVQSYYAETSPSVTTCLSRAIHRANLSLFEHNMQVSGHEKTTVGITCAVVRGDELFLAQVMPGQAYVVHKGRITSFPLHPSWDPEATSLPAMARLQALGWAEEEVAVEFFHSALSSGDVFCLCTSNIGRFLGRDDAEQVLLYQEPGDVVEQLYRRVHEQGFGEAHAVVVELQPAIGRAAEPLFSAAGLRERSRMVGETVLGWGALVAAEGRRIFQHPKKRRREPLPSQPPEAKPEPPPPPEVPALARPKPAKPWRETLRETVYGLFHPREVYPRLERPRIRMRAPREKRRLLPYLIAAAALVVLGLLTYLIVRGSLERREAELNLLIDQTRDQIAQAQEVAQGALPEDLAEANRILDQAEKILLAAIPGNAPRPRLELLLRDVREERDRINTVTRFEEVDLVIDLAAFSTTMAAEGFPGGCSTDCRLRDIVWIGDTIFLLEEEKGTIYAYSRPDNKISPLLWNGMELVSKGKRYTAGPILDIALLERPRDTESQAEFWLAAVDADRWLYLYRQGEWEVFVLHSESDWQGRAVDLEGYDGYVYVLKGIPGNILKYYRDAYELEPILWLEDALQVQLTDAVDMAIDGYIHLLLKNGTVQVLSQGRLHHSISYGVYPPSVLAEQVLVDPTYLDSPFLYVIDRYGRIIQLRKEAQRSFVRQIRGPEDDDLQDVRAAAVRESEGLFYMVVGSALYSGVLPPETQESVPLPSPSQSPE